MVEPLRHRQTKGAATDMLGLPSPRHIPTLPNLDNAEDHMSQPQRELKPNELLCKGRGI